MNKTTVELGGVAFVAIKRKFTEPEYNIRKMFYASRFTCRGLFERHKLLFSFQMCAKILEAAGKLNIDEYNFFLRGGVVSYLGPGRMLRIYS